MKKKILFVCGGECEEKIIKTILENGGFDVSIVYSGEKALNEVNLNGFSLLILDNMMPDMSGWDLFKRIIRIKPDYKVILLSIAKLSNEKALELKREGIKDFIQKPFSKIDFINRVKKVIEIN